MWFMSAIIKKKIKDGQLLSLFENVNLLCYDQHITCVYNQSLYIQINLYKRSGYLACLINSC